MSLTIATHSGPFHADDVLACALLRVFVDPDAVVTRTRDRAVIDQSDVVVDVGGRYEPAAGRFDHHQAAYEGPWSSAGMVLAWLAETERVGPALAGRFRREIVDYVDDVDNGRRSPDPKVPCFPLLVQALNQPASSLDEFDAAFAGAVTLADACVRGMVAAQDAEERAAMVVVEKMRHAAEVGSNLLLLDEYVRWKPAYFANGGETHPTEFVIHPGPDGSWRAGAIPPTQASFAQKVSLPLEWAGLTDAALEAVTGVAGARFCHKNRFIAVFSTREGLLEALSSAGLVRGPLG